VRYGLLGRDAELAVLRGALAHVVRTSESSAVLVRGEPGIGKSTLLRSFMESVPEVTPGQVVLVGYGQSMTNSLGSDAFQAIRECLRSLMSAAQRSRSREVVTRVAHAFRVHAPDWLESVPTVGAVLAVGVRTGLTMLDTPESAEQPLRSRLDQLIELVRELFVSGPVVLVLDDLHWADAATIDILMALALKVQGPLLRAPCSGCAATGRTAGRST
jgi:predicted ATPase